MLRENHISVLLLLVISCSDIANQDGTTFELLTDNTSKGWQMYEHNYTSDDNKTFVQIPPYIFLNIYSADYLLLKNDFTFKIGGGASVIGPTHEWSLSIKKDSIKLGDYNFVIVKLTANELILRHSTGPTEVKTLPYYEYRFKKTVDIIK